MFNPLIIWSLPGVVVCGNENISPAGTPYYVPSVLTQIDCHSSLPKAQSLMWSIEAEPAEAADDAPLKSIISAPLFYTLGVNSLIFHPSSIKLFAALPPIVQFLTSGYIVGEWLPQIVNFLISVVEDPVYNAS